MLKRIGVALGVVIAVSVDARSQVRLGPEIPVSSEPGWESQTAVATDAAGNFVVVWADRQNSSPGHSAIMGRLFLSTGVPAGGAFQVSSATAGWHDAPDVAFLPDGGFLVVWENDWRDSLMSPATLDIFARRYVAGGAPAGDAFRVNETTTGDRRRPDIAVDAMGRFVIVWDAFATGALDGIWGQRFDASGAAVGLEFAVNSYTTRSVARPAVASNAAGDFVVAWTGYDDDQQGIVARRFDASAIPLSGDFPVNASTTYPQVFPVVAADATGNFVVVWHTRYSANLEVYGQLFDATGVPRGGEFRASSFTTSKQGYASVAFDTNGNFVVAWMNLGGGYQPVAKLYDSAGAPHGHEFIVSGHSTSAEGYPSVAFDGNGEFVVAWQAARGDWTSSFYDVFAQRFAPDLIFRDGFESADLSAWSGAATDGGDLSAEAGAALKGTTIGLQGSVDDVAGLYVEDDSPTAEGRYRARFYVDPSGFDPGEAAGQFRTRLFVAFEDNPSRRVAAIVLRRKAGAYAVMARARRDDGSQADTAFYPLGTGPHFVEIDWQRASAPAANDGSLTLWIDGTPAGALAAVDNDEASVDFARLGALSVKAAATGTLLWDEFESRRLNYIGP